MRRLLNAAGAWCVSAIALAPGVARAGAWVAPLGGQSIHTEIVSTRADATYLESQYYLESPISSRTSVMARPWFESSLATGGWRGEVQAGLKRAVLRSDHAVVAVQASALWRSDAEFGCGEGGGELRALGGVAFAHGRGFINGEAAQRAQSGGCGARRFEVTGGYRIAPRWLGLAEAFVHDPERGDRAVKAQLSVVRFDEEGHGVQVGARFRIDGGEIEPALVIAFWRGR